MLDSIIFDLDGVLVQSEPAHAWAFQQLFAAEGVTFTRDDFKRRALGVPRRRVIEGVLGADLPPEKLARLMRDKVRYVEQYIDEQGLEPIPGALGFVHNARARGLKLAVATVSRTPMLFLNAIGAADLFDAVLDRTSVERPKPDPSVYLKALAALETTAAHALVIEDSPSGVSAAVAAGVRVLALTTTATAARLHQATAIFPDYSGIDLDHWIGAPP